jgi:hypothetical protein
MGQSSIEIARLTTLRDDIYVTLAGEPSTAGDFQFHVNPLVSFIQSGRHPDPGHALQPVARRPGQRAVRVRAGASIATSIMFSFLLASAPALVYRSAPHETSPPSPDPTSGLGRRARPCP